MTSTTYRWVLVALCVLLAVGGFIWFSMPWYMTLGLAPVVLIVAMVILKPVARDDGKIDHDAAFITCPSCGTKNPRHTARIYECYNCGKSFSELRGRFPTLPSKVSGSNADD